LKEIAREVDTEPRAFSISSIDLMELMQAVLAKDGVFQFRAGGSSMTPFIRSGDVITIASLDRRGARLGMVVAFKHPAGGHLVIHRIVGVAPGAVFIKGDNSPHRTDGWIPVGNLLGRVLEIRRNGKHVWLGLGIERYLIAFFSKVQWLIPIRSALAALRGRK